MLHADSAQMVDVWLVVDAVGAMGTIRLTCLIRLPDHASVVWKLSEPISCADPIPELVDHLSRWDAGTEDTELVGEGKDPRVKRRETMGDLSLQKKAPARRKWRGGVRV